MTSSVFDPQNRGGRSFAIKHVVEAGARAAQRFKPHFLLLLAGLVLPNLLSLLSLVQLVDIGLPPRAGIIFLYATLALCARRLPFSVTVTLYICLLAFDVVHTLSLMFGLAPTEFLAAIAHARRVDLLTPPLYLALSAAMFVVALAILVLLRQRKVLLRGNIYLLFAITSIFAAADYATNVSPYFHFGSAMGRGQPVTSASDASEFDRAAVTNRRNVVLVIVEGLGYLRDAGQRRRIAAPLYAGEVLESYDVSEGEANYFGSTTSAEMRELCHTNVFYKDFVRGRVIGCLPQRLRERGYETIAFHGFDRHMFDREQWYPILGFGRQLFRKELVALTGRYCGAGGAFPGACDGDLAPVISAAAKQQRSDRPLFVYWLTLNTHVPVLPGDAATDFGCVSSVQEFGHPTVCRMAELWHDVFKGAAALARDPKIGPAEILVVGDHAPPLWSKRARAQFKPGRVAWYRLTPRMRIASPH